MSHREQLQELRKEITALDEELIKLFMQRMEISGKIADVKMAGNISITDTEREKKVTEDAIAVARAVNPDLGAETEVASFVRSLLALSKQRQHKKLFAGTNLEFPASAKPVAPDARVAFQGVAGAWGENAAITLYPNGNHIAYDYFDDVFTAVKSGEADVGVLPIENSQTGAIGEVYDLLRRNGCYIVGEAWITVAQCLLAKEGVRLDEIREIYSHPEGLKQCRRFLKNRNWDLTGCRNTAVAAQMVAQKDDRRYAAIGSRRAAEVHGLSVLAPDIMDNANNKTRFIAIAAEPVYDKGCDTTGISFITAHVAGALCAVLQTFMVAGINLSRIESRPVSAEKYRFFADLKTNLLSPEALDVLGQAAMHCDIFEVLGCYPSSKQ